MNPSGWHRFSFTLHVLLPSGRQVGGFGRDGRGFEAFVLKKIIFYMIFILLFHLKNVYLHCFQRGSRTDYSAAPIRHVRCTATTQALHPNDVFSAPLLDDSVPCISPKKPSFMVFQFSLCSTY